MSGRDNKRRWFWQPPVLSPILLLKVKRRIFFFSLSLSFSSLRGNIVLKYEEDVWIPHGPPFLSRTLITWNVIADREEMDSFFCRVIHVMSMKLFLTSLRCPFAAGRVRAAMRIGLLSFLETWWLYQGTFVFFNLCIVCFFIIIFLGIYINFFGIKKSRLCIVFCEKLCR